VNIDEFNIDGFRQRLVVYIESHAHWRSLRAEEYPEDVRHERSSASLSALADYVRGLPDSDPNLLALAALREPHIADVFSMGEEASRRLSLFGFDDAESAEHFPAFLELLVDAAGGDWLMPPAQLGDDGVIYVGDPAGVGGTRRIEPGTREWHERINEARSTIDEGER
jgi:hypothetical protein